jgi:hypothetical protein
MKQKRFNKKLVLKKVTVSNLTNEEQLSIRGGSEEPSQDPCGGTVQGRTCNGESAPNPCQ